MELNLAFERYLTTRELGGCRPGTLEHYERVTRFFREYAEWQGVTDSMAVDPHLVRQYLLDRTARGNAAVTAKDHRAVLVSCMLWLADEGLAQDISWSRRVTNIKVDRREPKFLSPEELTTFLAASKAARNRDLVLRWRNWALVEVLVDTGVRLGELLRLNVQDVDLAKCTLRISNKSKGRCERVAYFSPETSKTLRRYLEVREQDEWPEVDPLWVSQRGDSERLSDQQVRVLVDKISQKARLGHVHPHMLRHTFCTQVLRAGVPLTIAAKLMGHSSTGITGRYEHLVQEDIGGAYAKHIPAAGIVAVGAASR